jgi:predicted SnoaL-like aldol condensation-catalyzing enzyme
MKNIKELTNDYFEAFSSKDEDKLRELYSEDFSLRDWLSEAKGKEKVLDINKQFFNAYPNFELKVLKTYTEGNTTVSELNILINDPLEGDKDILAVDVIEFSEEGKMKTLRAYFGS